MSFQVITIDEVSQFLSHKQNTYKDCLELIKMHFLKFMLSGGGEGKVYRIYSRGEKQRGNEYKEFWKIANDVNEMRKGKTIVVNGKRKKISAKPYFPIQDLPDIIGLTVVCVYPSDMKAVIGFIENEVNQGNLEEYDRDEKQERGYHAHHFVLGLCDPKYAGIRCEVQIKTLLHDAWTAKTHNLSYKPEGELDERMKKQMEILGDTLASIDEQSELIGSIIREKWVTDAIRKKGASKAILISLKNRCPQDAEKAKVFDKIIKDLEQNEEIYQSCDFRSTHIQNILDSIHEYLGNGNYDSYSCRMLVFLANLRPSNDLDNYVLDCIDRWIMGLSNPADKSDALLFKGLILYCFGRLEYAIQVTEESLKVAQNEGLNYYIIGAKGNLAYYLAELGDSPLAKKLNAKKKAKQYIDDALEKAKKDKDVPPNLNRSLKDTLGAVIISFGETPEDVRIGLKFCQEARDEATNTDREVSQLFYQIHERRAFRRILQWE